MPGASHVGADQITDNVLVGWPRKGNTDKVLASEVFDLPSHCDRRHEARLGTVHVDHDLLVRMMCKFIVDLADEAAM